MGFRSWLHRWTAPPPVGPAPDEACKLVLVVNHGLKMGKGKIAAQVGHASITAMTSISEHDRARLAAWLATGQRKVCVKGDDAEHLLSLRDLADNSGLPTATVRDAGHTQIPSGSLTVVAIGPAEASRIDRLTGDLKLL
ncbi:MAG: peptidyl-tRNA hydrolase [Euryarchaeota archaeon TMED141]|nr:MAG: peptidyl-tRNA hydrolase [Euryarchaeota archaeon TMED141]